MNEQVTEIEVVERPASLAVFDPLMKAIAEYKAENESLAFDYATQEQEVRSHCFKLRRIKGQAKAVHTKAKAKALAECQLIDSAKNEIFGAVDEMIDYHMKPINDIAAAKQKAIDDKAEAERLIRVEQEETRILAIEKAEEEIAAEREVLEAEKAAIADAEEKWKAEIKAEEEAIAAERAKLEDDKAAEKEKARIKASNEAARKETLAREEAERVADEEHREHVKAVIIGILNDALGQLFTSNQLVSFISENPMDELTINY